MPTMAQPCVSDTLGKSDLLRLAHSTLGEIVDKAGSMTGRQREAAVLAAAAFLADLRAAGVLR
jgi:hypothetical protein